MRADVDGGQVPADVRGVGIPQREIPGAHAFAGRRLYFLSQYSHLRESIILNPKFSPHFRMHRVRADMLGEFYS
ncbi:MAG: hypothetical protein ACLUVB_08030, partial [Acutalibacteraceae bacterium]